MGPLGSEIENPFPYFRGLRPAAASVSGFCPIDCKIGSPLVSGPKGSSIRIKTSSQI
ncbi:hypothetical protein CE91St49_22950 [Emergencia timonensis]|nr:hypothetical protein CE91St48_23010 [Emergencia timonensis]BDF12948.1 hypothetical protein CE91St49_22950 [Emergencia timonensis]